MSFKFSDNKVIVGLIIALALQIVILFWHLGWIPLFSSQSMSEGKEAGYVDSLDNTLKKRPINNLIWTRANEKEKVYFHDSLLTLSQSQASVHLDNGTEIKLSENTLITIEPPSQDSPEEIKIQFSKGHLQTRNPFKKSQIKDEQMTLSIKKDSQVDFSKNEKGDYEVVVKKGEAQVLTPKAEETLLQNQVLTFSKDKVLKKMEIDITLTWKGGKKDRFYTHDKSSRVELFWKGKADELILKTKKGIFKRISVDSSLEKKSFQLPLGDYQALLKKESRQSLRKAVEVRQAPVIHLLRPRPRDRVRIGKVGFQWEEAENVKAYELQLKGEQTNKQIKVGSSTQEVTLEKEDFLDWEVWGIDKEGFKVPPPYSYPLYIRKSLFAPPKTKKPKTIKKRQGAWYDWIFPPLYAETPEVALLSWEKIEFAEIYTVEISTSKTFRELVHKVEVSKNRYEFKEATKDQTYYWRVAAGDRQGNMGAFSEPAIVSWVSIEEPKPKLHRKKAVKTKKKPIPLKTSRKKEEKAKKTSPQAKPNKISRTKEANTKKKQSIPSKDILKSIYVAYTPQYSLKQYQMPLNTRSYIQGPTTLSFTTQFNFSLTANFDAYLLAKFDQSEYQPTQESPFQGNIKSRRLQGLLGIESKHNKWGLAAFVADLPISSRVGFEEITLNQSLAYGALGSYQATLWGFDYFGLFGPSFTNSFVGGYTSHRFLYPVFYESLKLGWELEGFYHTEGSQSSTIFNFNIHLGWEF